MKISATVHNTLNQHRTEVKTNNDAKGIDIKSKASGYGSSVNGGELLFLALATCFCNDIYREAAKKNLKVNAIEVEVSGDFRGEGETASNITYSARVDADATEQEIAQLITETDKVAEIQNTLRKGVNVTLVQVK